MCLETILREGLVVPPLCRINISPRSSAPIRSARSGSYSRSRHWAISICPQTTWPSQYVRDRPLG